MGTRMFEQAFKNIDDVLRKEAGCTTELDYTEQTSWLLFLKYLDGLEQDKATEAELAGKKHTYILDKPYRWESWAASKGKDGKLDHNSAMTGDDLRDFVNQKLFLYLHGFTQKASGPNTIEYKIGQIFGEIRNKISSGYNLREIIDHIDELRFRSQTEKHELSHLYEAFLLPFLQLLSLTSPVTLPPTSFTLPLACSSLRSDRCPHSVSIVRVATALFKHAVRKSQRPQ
jgi:type I restriction enzyme M protein